MKKLLMSTAIAAFLITSFTSCKKEVAKNTPVLPVEKGIVAALVKGKIVDIWDDPYEVGLKFKTSVKGSIKSILLSLPVTKVEVVTLWRVSDQSIIASTPVNCTSIGSWDNIATVDIPVEADTEYILSTNTSYYYVCTIKNEVFPYKTGHVILLGYTAETGSEHVFPGTHVNNLGAGFTDFTFQPAE